MFDRIFANYLVECGKLGEQDLNSIYASQESKRVRLGVIAVAEKLMTIEQVEEVNQLQAVLDKRFGDIAVEKGYLNDEQVSRLLVLQGNAYLALVQAIVDGGYLTMDEIEEMLVRFQKENNMTASNIDDLKSCDVDRIISIYLYAQSDFIKGLAGVIVRTMVRLVDYHVFIGKPVEIKEYPYKYMCAQGIEGDHKILTAFSGDINPSLKDAAISFAGADNVTCDEDVVDALCEFVNCVNGLFASEMSNHDIDIDMDAPLGLSEPGNLKADKILSIPVVMCGNKLDLLMIVDHDYTF